MKTESALLTEPSKWSVLRIVETVLIVLVSVFMIGTMTGIAALGIVNKIIPIG